MNSFLQYLHWFFFTLKVLGRVELEWQSLIWVIKSSLLLRIWQQNSHWYRSRKKLFEWAFGSRFRTEVIRSPTVNSKASAACLVADENDANWCFASNFFREFSDNMFSSINCWCWCALVNKNKSLPAHHCRSKLWKYRLFSIKWDFQSYFRP